MKITNRPSNRPSSDLVLRIAGEEAAAARAKLDDVLAMRRCGRATHARRHAWARIIRETECSVSGLADVWGCDRQAIHKALEAFAAPPAPPRPIYDTETILRLASRHGHERAAQIAAGNDASTNIDIAKWRALGARA